MGRSRWGVRNVMSVMFSTVVAAVLALLCAPYAAAQGPWFADQVGVATQVVAVNGTSGSNATLEAWQRSAVGWHRVSPPVPAMVGEAGFTDRARDGFPATPTGVYSLDSVFG